MKKSKPEHRREYWKYHVASHSFEQARDVASQLLNMSNSEAMYYPLMISLHVLYARPFKHPKNSRRISSTLVPSDITSIHDKLLQMRDRIFAHHDKDSKIIDFETGVDLFQLVVEVKGGEIKPAVQTIFHGKNQLGKIKSLCDHLYRTCMKKAHETLIKCIGVPLKDGTYRVSTDFERRVPLLIRSERSTEQSCGHLKETRRRMPNPGN